jgi:hypothetical protein
MQRIIAGSPEIAPISVSFGTNWALEMRSAG